MMRTHCACFKKDDHLDADQILHDKTITCLFDFSFYEFYRFISELQQLVKDRGGEIKMG